VLKGTIGTYGEKIMSIKKLNEKTQVCFSEIYKRKCWDDLIDHIPHGWDGRSTFTEEEVSIALD
jgi:hypothetical protein